MSAESGVPDRQPGLFSAQRAFSAAGARQAELRHAVRVSVAVGVAFAVSSLLHLPQGYWAVFTAVIVVQTSIGATITASVERLMGTVVGGAVGVGAAYLKAQTVLEEGLILSGAIALLAFAAAVRPSLRVAPITAAIVLVGGSSAHMPPLMAALWRVGEIFIGSAIGLAATVLIFPAPARKAVVARVAQTIGQLADLLDLYARHVVEPVGEAQIHAAQQASRKSLAQVEQAVTETARENASGLRASSIPDGLGRTIWRVRTDSIMVWRALAQPLPPTVAQQLAAPAADLLSAMAQALRTCAQAIQSSEPVRRGVLRRPRAVFEEAVERVRQAKLTSDMGFDVAARVYGLVFALESLLTNVQDLADRIDEMATDPPPPSAPI